MGRSEVEERRCKKHPKHRLSTGVCPFCLREKLSQLSKFIGTSSSSYKVYSSTASSSPYSAYDDESDNVSSSAASTPRYHNNHEVKRARMSSLFKSDRTNGEGSHELKKSKSLIYVVGGEKDKDEEIKEKKKNRFWLKFLSGGRRKRREVEEMKGEHGLIHSKTLKEKSAAKWVLFS